jgi:hypothetical protein
MQKIGETERFTDIATSTTDYGIVIQDAIYDVIRDAQISFPWVELDTYLLIATADPTFTDPLGFGFSYRYEIPEDYLRPLNEELYSYRRQGDFIYANLPEDLPFHYIRYEEDVTKWSGQQFKVILYRLAEEVVMPITQSPELLGQIVALKERAEAEARRLGSYNQRYPNERRRRRGQLSQLRAGYGRGFNSNFFNGAY